MFGSFLIVARTKNQTRFFGKTSIKTVTYEEKNWSLK